jgi:hypothetical protein
VNPPPTSDPKRVRAWVIAKLDAMDEEQFDQKMMLLADPDVQVRVLEIAERQLTELRSKERAIAEGDCGNMKPLRSSNPNTLGSLVVRPSSDVANTSNHLAADGTWRRG